MRKVRSKKPSGADLPASCCARSTGSHQQAEWRAHKHHPIPQIRTRSTIAYRPCLRMAKACDMSLALCIPSIHATGGGIAIIETGILISEGSRPSTERHSISFLDIKQQA